MKLCRVRRGNQIVVAIADGQDQIRDVSALLPDLTAAALGDGSLDRLRDTDPSGLPMIDTPDFAPVLSVLQRIFCIGLNYSDHAAEAGMPIPEHPIVFMKVCEPTGANDPIMLPKGSEKTDWEVELGVVIGKRAQHVPEADALDHVAGYCVVNDVSERAFQLDFAGQWVKGKSCDSFAPVGPYLVTPDEIGDPQALDLFLDVNGARCQTGNTRTMIFSVAEIIAHLSRFVTLRPGDLISTGTPPGVGMGMNPPKYLRPGDIVHLGVDGLGTQTQRVVAFAPS